MFGIGGDRQVLSLDWDTKTLRAVQWQLGKKSARVRRLVSAAIPASVQVKDADSLGAFVKDVLAHERIRTTPVIVDIPRDQAVLNTMSLPAANLNDLAGMVQLQIAKELPFPLNLAVVDFAVGEQPSRAGTSDVLVAAIRREGLEFCQQVCDVAGLKLERVGLRPYANMVAVSEMLGSEVAGRVLVVDVGPMMTEIDVLRDGGLVFSRAASVHLDDPDYSQPQPDDEDAEADLDIESQSGPKIAQEELLDHLAVEITRSAEAYRSTDPGARFDHVVVAGSCDFEDALAKVLSQRFMVKAKVYAPDHILTRRQLGTPGLCSFAAAIGLGLGHAGEGRLHFDFLHPKKPVDARIQRLKQLPLVGVAAAVLVLIGVAAYFIGIHPVDRKVAEIESEIKRYEEQVEKFEEAGQAIDLVEQWEAQQLDWPKLLTNIIAQLPDDNEVAFLEDLRLQGGKGMISFEIMANSSEILEELRGDLESLTREGPKAGKTELMFVVDDVDIESDRKLRDYPWHANMVVVSDRFKKSEAALKEKRSKTKSKK